MQTPVNHITGESKAESQPESKLSSEQIRLKEKIEEGRGVVEKIKQIHLKAKEETEPGPMSGLPCDFDI